MNTKTETRQTSLKRRIRRFFKLRNEGDFERCQDMIDPLRPRRARTGNPT